MEIEHDFFSRLDRTLDFQINDLKIAFEAVKVPFLIANGCMNVIEFLGGLRNGKLGEPGNAECRFKEGVKLLGSDFGLFRYDAKIADEDDMWDLRCGLTHQYLPKIENISIIVIYDGLASGGRAQQARDEHVSGSVLTVDVSKLLGAIQRARITLMSELKENGSMKASAEIALARLPELW
jgi:hypothetical protein